MSDEQQPRAEWIFPEQKKRSMGRLWLIIGLVVAAFVIVGIVLFFLIPRDGRSIPDASGSPSPTTMPSTPPSPLPADSTAPAPEPSSPETAAPAVPNPDFDTFTAQVQPRLEDAARGLDLVAENMDVGAQIVDSLQQDAEVLSDTPAPSTVAERWNAAVIEYAKALNHLRSAVDSGTDARPSLDDSRAALNELHALAGL